jgi:hypothetical protein
MYTFSIAERADVEWDDFVVLRVEIEDSQGQSRVEFLEFGDTAYRHRKLDIPVL